MPLPLLTWAPPAGWETYTTYTIPATGGTHTLDENTDYKISAPSTITEAVHLRGGRNVVWIGGHIHIADKAALAPPTSRRALVLSDHPTQPTVDGRIMHLEGLLLDGNDLSEGIDLNAPKTIFQLQNFHCDTVLIRGCDDRDRTGAYTVGLNHADVLQPWGGFKECRVDGLTGKTNYQGMYFMQDTGTPTRGPAWFKRLNLAAVQTIGEDLYTRTAKTTNAGTDNVEDTGHGIVNDNQIEITASTDTALTVGNTYHVVSAATDTFQLSLTQGGAAIDLAGGTIDYEFTPSYTGHRLHRWSETKSGIQYVDAGTVWFQHHVDSGWASGYYKHAYRDVGGSGNIELDASPGTSTFADNLYPAVTTGTDATGTYAEWTQTLDIGGLGVQNWAGTGPGRVYSGAPPGGDYVPSADVGLSYTSPGYAAGTVTVDLTVEWDVDVTATGAFTNPTIGGVPLQIIEDTLLIEDAIEVRTVATFAVEADVGVRFEKGYEVVVDLSPAHVTFKGVVELADVVHVPAGNYNIWSITAIDWHYLADKRLYSAAHTSTTGGDVIRDIITTVLAAEGVTEGTVEDGHTLDEVALNWLRADEAIARVAAAVQKTWWIDKDKRLHMVSPGAITAPWAITWDTAAFLTPPRLADGNQRYRNAQTVRGAIGETVDQVESFTGDGTRRTFTVAYPIGRVPTVKVNTVTKTVGIRGVDTGKDWYWNAGQHLISQDPAGTLLTSSDTLEVTYKGQFPLIVNSRSYGEIDRLAGLESTSGIVEAVEDANGTRTRSAAFDTANTRLTQYARDARVLTFVTSRGGLAAGHVVTVDLPEYGLTDEEFLITLVATMQRDGLILCHVTAVQGPTDQDWTRFYTALAAGPSTVVRENVSEVDSVEVLHAVTEQWTWGETVTPTVYACELYGTGLYGTAAYC